jgi:hypothetical protein
MNVKLICPECRHENEAERIYCHSCGARLERSAAAQRKEPVQETQKRVRKMFDPQREKFRQLFFRTSKLILGACAAAAVVLMILPPDVPPPTKTPMIASQVRIDLENLAGQRQPAQVQLTEDQVNAYLINALKTKQSSLNKPLLNFKRAVVGFGERICAVTTERSLFGYPLYTSCSYAPALTEGKIVAPAKGGKIGRLKIHPQVTQFMGVLFGDVWSALDQEKKLVAKLGAIEFHDKNVVLIAPAP